VAAGGGSSVRVEWSARFSTTRTGDEPKRAIRQNETVPMMPMPLMPGEVHVWWRLTARLEGAEVERALALLSNDERERHDRFLFPRDRRDYAAAHALLRTSLSRYAPVTPQSWRFRQKPGGKPALVPAAGTTPLSFNLSHTDGLVACAIASGDAESETGTDGSSAGASADSGIRLGIDVEALGRMVDDTVAARFFSTEEAAELRGFASAAARNQRFLEMWTLKEAYLKGIGEGLAHPLNTVTFERAGDGSIELIPKSGIDAARWRFAQFTPAAGYCLAVAVCIPQNATVSVALMDGQ
jgi:4'-phosphopantetheinyl transferase